MRHHFWTVLFGIVFIFSAIREHQFVLIYYTVWTFILELVYFLCKSLNLSSIADILWPFLLAPSIVVCVGFWIIVAPMQFMHHPPENIVMVFVTHGLNMVAAILEKKKSLSKRHLETHSVHNIVQYIFGHLRRWWGTIDQRQITVLVCTIRPTYRMGLCGPGSGRHGYYALYHRGPRTHTNI